MQALNAIGENIIVKRCNIVQKNLNVRVKLSFV